MKHDFYTEKHKFTPLKGFEHDYSIAKDGTILSLLTDQIVKPSVNSNGYLKVTLHKDGSTCTRQVHILVAQQFIPNPDNLPVVNHIDGNKQNPNVTNLEWCTQQENVIHAHKTGLQKKTHDKMVVRGDGRVYRSLTEAATKNYITKSAISKVIHGVHKTAGGWTWKEVEDATELHEDYTADNRQGEQIP